MGTEGLKIVIGADIGAAVSGIGKLTNAMAGIDDAASSAAGAMNKIPAALRPINPAQMHSLSTAVQKLKQDITKFPRDPIPDPFRNIPKGANQAGQALTNVGRVAQDLPFGFLGIQNNLNPLLESFQRLKTETGSSKAALKALGSSLVGAGGIGLALSVVSSAFLIFQNGIAGFNSKAKEAKNSAEGFAKALEESNKQAGSEIARVQVLNAVISDNTRSQADRKKGAKELSDILKDLNTNMSKEAILNGQVAEATKLATAAILERAKARAAENRIAELSGQQLQRDIKRKSVVDDLTKATQRLNDQQKIQGQVIGGSTLGVGGNTIGATQKVISLQKEITNLDKASGEANKEIQQLLATITSQDLNVEFKEGGKDKTVDVLKQRIAALKELQSLTGLDLKQRLELAQLEVQLTKRDAVKLGFTPSEVKEKIQAQINEIFPQEFTNFRVRGVFQVDLEPSKIQKPKPLSEGQVQDIAKATGLETIDIPAPKITFTNLDTAATDALAQLNATINNLVTGVQVEALSTLGEAIGTALTGGNVGNVFISFFGFLADGLKQLGKALIAYGIALLGFRVAIKSMNPVAALVAGAGALIAGSLVKAALPKLPAFAEGGIVTGPMIGQVGEMYKPEVIMPLDRLQAMLGQGNNTSGGMQLIPIINNEGLFLAMKRGERRVGRMF
jgi:hypothetical protein